MTEPLVSIIIPCYNYGHFLTQTLENVADLAYANWECIIVDDGSKDNSGEAAKVYTGKDERFRYLYQENQGLSAARNTGIINSKGLYVQFLDADDQLDKNKIFMQAAFLEEHPGVDIVFGDFLYFNSDNPDQKIRGRDKAEHAEEYLKASGQGIKMAERFCINNFMPVSAPLIRRSIIEKTGLFDTTYTSYEDWQYWFRCCLQDACFEYLPLHGTETYIRFGHASMMGNKKKMVENGIRIRKFMMPYLPPRLKSYNKYRLIKLQLRALTGI